MWSSDIEAVLQKISQNSRKLGKDHKKTFHYYEHISIQFAIPGIILSAVTATLPSQLAPYCTQIIINLTTTCMMVVSTILQSIALYLHINENVNASVTSTKSFDDIATDIQVMLHLSRDNREQDGKTFLKEIMDHYKLARSEAKILRTKFEDELFDLSDVRSSTSDDSPLTPYRMESMINNDTELL